VHFHEFVHALQKQIPADAPVTLKPALSTAEA
jgi:hypothetical protein